MGNHYFELTMLLLIVTLTGVVLMVYGMAPKTRRQGSIFLTIGLTMVAVGITGVYMASIRSINEPAIRASLVNRGYLVEEVNYNPFDHNVSGIVNGVCRTKVLIRQQSDGGYQPYIRYATAETTVDMPVMPQQCSMGEHGN